MRTFKRQILFFLCSSKNGKRSNVKKQRQTDCETKTYKLTVEIEAQTGIQREKERKGPVQQRSWKSKNLLRKKWNLRNGKVPATSDSSAGSLVFAHAHNYRIQTQQKKAELLRGSKKKRNEEKVKTEENCARASTREKLAKKLKSVLVQCLCEKEHRVRAPFKIPLKLMITTTTMVIVTCALNINCGE